MITCGSYTGSIPAPIWQQILSTDTDIPEYEMLKKSSASDIPEYEMHGKSYASVTTQSVTLRSMTRTIVSNVEAVPQYCNASQTEVLRNEREAENEEVDDEGNSEAEMSGYEGNSEVGITPVSGVDFCPDIIIDDEASPWCETRVITLDGVTADFLVDEDEAISLFVAISVNQAVDQLNDGIIDCDEDFCFFYIASLEKHCILHRDMPIETVLHSAGVKQAAVSGARQ